MIKLKTSTRKELTISRTVLHVESVVELYKSSRPNCAAPPISKTRTAKDPYPILRKIAPDIVIPLFYQQISSGSGARSIPILVSPICKSLIGMQGVQRN